MRYGVGYFFAATAALKIAVKVAQEIKTFAHCNSTFFRLDSLPFRRRFVSGSSITINDPYGIDVPAQRLKAMLDLGIE